MNQEHQPTPRNVIDLEATKKAIHDKELADGLMRDDIIDTTTPITTNEGYTEEDLFTLFPPDKPLL